MSDKAFKGVERGIHSALVTLQQYINRPPTPDALMTHGGPPHQQLADQALAYLDAVTPYNHPARLTLLWLSDIVRRWRVSGHPGPGADCKDTGHVAAALLDAYEGQIPEVYTLTSIQDVDTWLSSNDRPDVSVRLVAASGIVGLFGGWHGQQPQAGHTDATLVFYMEGLPIAQAAVNQLVQLTDVEDAVRVANYPLHPNDHCGHIERGTETACNNEPSYVAMTDGVVRLLCQGHLAVTLGSRGAYVIAIAPF